MEEIKIYLILNESLNKPYVGQTKQSLQKRWRGHIDRANLTSKRWRGPLHEDIKKLGVQCFSVSLLTTCDSQILADQLEAYWIGFYRAKYGYSYNIREAGAHGKHAPQTIEKYKGKIVSESTRKKLAESHTGKKANENQLAALRLGWKVPRVLHGTRNPNSLLTYDQVQEIKQLLSEGKQSQQKIADRYGIAQVTVSAIKRGIIGINQAYYINQRGE